MVQSGSSTARCNNRLKLAQRSQGVALNTFTNILLSVVLIGTDTHLDTFKERSIWHANGLLLHGFIATLSQVKMSVLSLNLIPVFSDEGLMMQLIWSHKNVWSIAYTQYFL